MGTGAFLSSTRTIENIFRLHHSIWFGKFIGTDLLRLYDIFITRCIRKAQSIIKDTSHPAHTLFSLLPSGKCYQSIKSHTAPFRDSFFPQVVRIMNSIHTHKYAHTDTNTLLRVVQIGLGFFRYHLIILSFVGFVISC